MAMPHIARVVDFLAGGLLFGATAWFFFIQSPVLLKMLGRERFVPIQMRLTKVLFRVLSILGLILLGAALGHAPLLSASVGSAAVVLGAVLVNHFLIVPQALRAGGASRSDIKGLDAEGSTAHFASEGVAGGTQVLHRLVVLFVLLLLGGVITHGLGLLNP